MNVNPDQFVNICEAETTDGLRDTALHSDIGFVHSYDIDIARANNANLGLFDEPETVTPIPCVFEHFHAGRVVPATVYAMDFLCDEHWLYCQKCGTGYFYGIEWAGCPKCDAAAMKECA